MNIYTIGFAKKSAEKFFSLLEKNKIKKIIDIRLNNTSQLAGFTKEVDLKFFLKRISEIKYEHDIELSPTKDILDNYKKKIITWEEYENKFNKLLDERQIINHIKINYKFELNMVCFLCSEAEAKYCHRRLVVEYLNKHIKNIDIKHL